LGKHPNLCLYASNVILIEVNDVGCYFAVSGGGSSDHGKHTNLDSFLLQAQNSIYIKKSFFISGAFGA
jgi:hypothetical protein